MTEKEFKKYVELILSMCTHFLLGGIDKKTFVSNLGLIHRSLQRKWNNANNDSHIHKEKEIQGKA